MLQKHPDRLGSPPSPVMDGVSITIAARASGRSVKLISWLHLLSVQALRMKWGCSCSLPHVCMACIGRGLPFYPFYVA